MEADGSRVTQFLEAVARGDSLCEIAVAHGVSRQRIQQRIIAAGLHEQWRRARAARREEMKREASLPERVEKKLPEWQQAMISKLRRRGHTVVVDPRRGIHIDGSRERAWVRRVAPGRRVYRVRSSRERPIVLVMDDGSCFYHPPRVSCNAMIKVGRRRQKRKEPAVQATAQTA